MKKHNFLLCNLFFSLVLIMGCAATQGIAIPEEDTKVLVLPTSEAVKEEGENIQYNIKVLIPDGWHLLKQGDGTEAIAKGYLNEDKNLDVALAIENDDDKDLRALLIAFGTDDKKFLRSVRADQAIMQVWEGGTFGDPFQEVKIERGAVLLKFFGGGNERWHRYYRFKYIDNDWYLIGYTKGAYIMAHDIMEVLEEDYDLLTGDYSIDIMGEDGKIKTTRGNRGKKQLIRLEDFDAGMDETDF